MGRDDQIFNSVIIKGRADNTNNRNFKCHTIQNGPGVIKLCVEKKRKITEIKRKQKQEQNVYTVTASE